MISEPRDTFCKSMPMIYMPQKVATSTRGMQPATTMPVLIPRLKKLTIRTIMTASLRVLTNSSMDSSTTFGWSDT